MMQAPEPREAAGVLASITVFKNDSLLTSEKKLLLVPPIGPILKNLISPKLSTAFVMEGDP